MSFINAVVCGGPGVHLEFRMHIRYELINQGLLTLVDVRAISIIETLAINKYPFSHRELVYWKTNYCKLKLMSSFLDWRRTRKSYKDVLIMTRTNWRNRKRFSQS